MSVFVVRAYAKVNLFLHIGPRRDDGFHELESLFQTISLHDELTVEISDEFELLCSDPSIPVDRRNLVTRAFWLLREAFGVPTLRVRLRKNIPAGGGLGGGSSDSAALLRVVGPLLDTTFDTETLHEIAAELGSDVPFFLHGGTAYARGRGEELRPLTDIPQQSMTLLLPPFGVETAACYRTLATMRQEGRASVQPFIGREAAQRLATTRIDDWPEEARRNDLEPPAFELEPRLRELIDPLRQKREAFTLMSGSGSTIFTTAQPEAAAVRTVTVTTVSREEATRITHA